MAKTIAKPFLKWAGGKTQLLEELTKRLPKELGTGGISSFIEPFIGGGAVFFQLNNRFSFDDCHIFDKNPELFLTYSVVQRDVECLIDFADPLASRYDQMDEIERKEYYYTVRELYNKLEPVVLTNYDRRWILKAAMFIFLNRTCFNGLYRVNSNGGFNVPFGRYKNPRLINHALLRADSEVLQNADIHLGDYSCSFPYISEDSFVYFDPPYRPLNTTSSFTSYNSCGFDDESQRRLADFFKKCDAKGAKLMLSNSDPKNADPDDNFFDDLYDGFRIERVPAKRMINSDAGKRGEVSEIVVMNY